MSAASSWTEERVRTLTRLWRDGASASQIARRLGGVTRNAVIGKIHRLGLSGRAKPSAPGGRRADPGPRAERRRRGGRATPAARPLPTPPPVAEGAPPATGWASVLSVRRGQCRWPIGDPLQADFCLCGRPAVRGAYCAPHGALAYRAAPRDHRLREAGMG